MILKRFILPILVVPLLFAGCASQEEIKCYLPSINASSNSPLVPGGNLQLKTTVNEDPTYSYKWTGPNGFESNLPNPVVNNVTLAMAGDYKVKTIKGICESTESTAIVEIVAPSIPCNPQNNTMTFTGGSFAPINLGVYTTTSGGDFQIRASGTSADLKIEFYNEDTPSPGIYEICNNCPTSFLTSKQVCVSMVYANYYTTARAGNVYLSLVNGKLSATFCNIIFKPGSFTLNASTKITSSN